jgi:hypothetical protein
MRSSSSDAYLSLVRGNLISREDIRGRRGVGGGVSGRLGVWGAGGLPPAAALFGTTHSCSFGAVWRGYQPRRLEEGCPRLIWGPPCGGSTRCRPIAHAPETIPPCPGCVKCRDCIRSDAGVPSAPGEPTGRPHGRLCCGQLRPARMLRSPSAAAHPIRRGPPDPSDCSPLITNQDLTPFRLTPFHPDRRFYLEGGGAAAPGAGGLSSFAWHQTGSTSRNRVGANGI